MLSVTSDIQGAYLSYKWKIPMCNLLPLGLNIMHLDLIQGRAQTCSVRWHDLKGGVDYGILQGILNITHAHIG